MQASSQDTKSLTRARYLLLSSTCDGTFIPVTRNGFSNCKGEINAYLVYISGTFLDISNVLETIESEMFITSFSKSLQIHALLRQYCQY